jgi:hypothetical protein
MSSIESKSQISFSRNIIQNPLRQIFQKIRRGSQLLQVQQKQMDLDELEKPIS